MTYCLLFYNSSFVRGSILKESKLFPSRIDPFSEVKQKSVKIELLPLNVYSFP